MYCALSELQYNDLRLKSFLVPIYVPMIGGIYNATATNSGELLAAAEIRA
jgi:hypothetical protein